MNLEKKNAYENNVNNNGTYKEFNSFSDVSADDMNNNYTIQETEDGEPAGCNIEDYIPRMLFHHFAEIVIQIYYNSNLFLINFLIIIIMNNNVIVALVVFLVLLVVLGCRQEKTSRITIIILVDHVH